MPHATESGDDTRMSASRRREMPLLAIAGGILAGVLFLSTLLLGMKWLLLFAFLSAAGFAVSLVATRLAVLELIVLGAFIFMSSARVDVHFFRENSLNPGFAVTTVDVCWLALMLFWLFRLVSDKERVVQPTPYCYFFYVVLATVVIGGLRAPTFFLGLRAVTLAFQAYLLFLYLANRRFTKNEYHWVVLGVCATLGVQAVIGTLQEATQSNLGLDFFGASESTLLAPDAYGLSFSRVGGTLGHPNQFAKFLGAWLWVPLVMVAVPDSRWARMGYLGVFLVATVPLVLTRSRGGWIGVFVVLILLGFLFFARRVGLVRATLLCTWFVVLLSVAALLVPATQERLLSDDYGAAESRIPMNLTALNMIASHPFFGVGRDNYLERFHEYDASGDGHTYRFPYPVHNAFLLLASEYGLLMLVAFLGLLVVSFRDSLELFDSNHDRFPRFLGIALCAGILCNVIIWQVALARPMTDPSLWFLMGLLFSITRFHRAQKLAEGETSS